MQLTLGRPQSSNQYKLSSVANTDEFLSDKQSVVNVNQATLIYNDKTPARAEIVQKTDEPNKEEMSEESLHIT